jgi:UDP-N-acetylmuramate--alanine ligase
MIAPDLTVPIPDEIRAVHFIGIGGSGISGLARMFLNAGIPVSGSDRAESQNTRDLEELGARVFIGHDAGNLDVVPDLDTVVYTGAIWPENPEFLAAKERGLSVLHRSQALMARRRRRA